MNYSCATLITSHCNTENACLLNRVATRTHQATAGHLSQLYFWDHDIVNEHLSGLLKREITDLGGIYVPVVEPYHQTKYWNDFMRSSRADYVVLASADVIFYHGWLEQLLRYYSASPDLLSVHPVAFSPWHAGLSYFCEAGPRPDVLHTTANPLCHVLVHRLANKYFWDEQFPYYEADMDYHLHMERSGKRAGVVTSSRVDHLEGSIIRHEAKGVVLQPDAGIARKRLEAKWNLSPPV